MQGQTRLAGCRVDGPVESGSGKEGGVWFKKRLECESGGVRKEVQLVEHFLPTRNSVRWELELNGQGSAWSTAIETQLQFQNPEKKQFWTAWGDPRPKEMRDSASEALLYWADPLILPPFDDRKLWYGAPYYRYDQPWGPGQGAEGDVFSIPLATVVESKAEVGLECGAVTRRRSVGYDARDVREGRRYLVTIVSPHRGQ